MLKNLLLLLKKKLLFTIKKQNKTETPLQNFGINVNKEKNNLISNDPIIDSKIEYWVEGIDLFNTQLNLFYKKMKIGSHFLSIYLFFYEKYPESVITLWLIKNTKIGSFQVFSNSCKILGIRHFLWFKGRLIYVESYYLNHNNVTLKHLFKLSLIMNESLYMRQQGYYSLSYPPASVAFEATAIVPEKMEAILDINNWERSVEYAFFPHKPIIY